VFGDHHASDRVAYDARHEYHRVHDGHGHDYVQRIPFGHDEVIVPRIFRSKIQLNTLAAATTVVVQVILQ